MGGGQQGGLTRWPPDTVASSARVPPRGSPPPEKGLGCGLGLTQAAQWRPTAARASHLEIPRNAGHGQPGPSSASRKGTSCPRRAGTQHTAVTAYESTMCTSGHQGRRHTRSGAQAALPSRGATGCGTACSPHSRPSRGKDTHTCCLQVGCWAPRKQARDLTAGQRCQPETPRLPLPANGTGSLGQAQAKPDPAGNPGSPVHACLSPGHGPGRGGRPGRGLILVAVCLCGCAASAQGTPSLWTSLPLCPGSRGCWPLDCRRRRGTEGHRPLRVPIAGAHTEVP